MGSILEDYVEGKYTRYNNKQIKKNKNKKAHISEVSKYRADIAIKVCPRCKRTWEQAIHSKTIIRHPKGNVPTYGKKRKICPICKKK